MWLSVFVSGLLVNCHLPSITGLLMPNTEGCVVLASCSILSVHSCLWVCVTSPRRLQAMVTPALIFSPASAEVLADT
jgi:hypothetical protein